MDRPLAAAANNDAVLQLHARNVRASEWGVGGGGGGGGGGVQPAATTSSDRKASSVGAERPLEPDGGLN